MYVPISVNYSFGDDNAASICELIDLEQTKYKTGKFSEQFFCSNTEILATRTLSKTHYFIAPNIEKKTIAS